MTVDFDRAYKDLTGKEAFPWQQRLYETKFLLGEIPSALDIPTGLGKTSVMALWLIARAACAALPRRLIYIVDRRVVVDQATSEAIKLQSALQRPECAQLRKALGLETKKLAISTLRGDWVDNREWLADPAAPAIVVGTVDMIGSRLLFSGYGVSRKMRPYYAGFLGADCLIVLDEAHLVPPFENLLRAIVHDADAGVALNLASPTEFAIPATRLMTLSATGRASAEPAFGLEPSDTDKTQHNDIVLKRLHAHKALTAKLGVDKLVDALVEAAISVTSGGPIGQTCLVYVNSRNDAEKIATVLTKEFSRKKGSKAVAATTSVEVELLVGARRIKERKDAEKRLTELGLIAGSPKSQHASVFLVATSAGEVGIDLDADHMVCDLVPWERMVQRLGRVNRRGEGQARVIVVAEALVEPKKPDKPTEAEKWARERHDFMKLTGDLLQELPLLGSEEGRDASPGALRELRQKSPDLIQAASTPPPLRPALTRAHVEAWSMTSLDKHTGRAEIAPWLRGWVEDDAQTTIVWRMHLPVRDDGTIDPKKIEAFFEAAPIGLSEQLETEGFRAFKWLDERAEDWLKKQEKSGEPNPVQNSETDTAEDASDDDRSDDTPLRAEADDESIAQQEATAQRGAASVSPPPIGRKSDVIALILDPQGDFDRMIRLADFEDSRKRDRLKEDFARRDGMTLVVRADFGGLRAGLLNKDDADTVSAADTAPDDFQAGFKVVRCKANAGEPQSGGKDFIIRVDDDGSPTEWLEVEKSEGASTNQDGLSLTNSTNQSLQEHVNSVVKHADAIALGLTLSAPLSRVLSLAAKLHDEGKKANLWQQAFNAPKDNRPFGKTKGPINHQILKGYRHEFGSLLDPDVKVELARLDEDLRDLVAHLIAAHHGHARPLMPTDGVDVLPPQTLQGEATAIALRFARLQARYGPWGLAWIESLLRAADQRASGEKETA